MNFRKLAVEFLEVSGRNLKNSLGSLAERKFGNSMEDFWKLEEEFQKVEERILRSGILEFGLENRKFWKRVF